MSESSESGPYPESESEFELSINENNGSTTDTNKRGRKRFREPEQHLENVRKRNRNLGLPYTSKKGKNVDGKHFTNLNCNCRFECFKNISLYDRMKVFHAFWKIGSFSGQNAYLCGLVKKNYIKQKRPRNNTRQGKSCSNTYFIHIESKSVKVCKSYFLKTFQISDGRMTRALQKLAHSSPGEDLRGRHPPANRTPDGMRQSVRDHISQFPAYQSHYTRTHNPNRRYLSSELNIRLMYNLYVEKCDGRNEPKVSEAIYRNIFHKDFNLHFHTPSKDTCTKCDTLKIKIDIETDAIKKKTYQNEKLLHLCKAEKARSSMKEDQTKSILNAGKIYSFSFDLEKALPFPMLSCSVAYYKRNMYVYNLGCHNLGNEIGYMYAWDETKASRGSQEISSCIKKHISTYASNCEHIIAYSDACTGQNRNIKMSLMWLHMVAELKNVKTIDHKFLVSGHSYLPNDRDFGTIETYAKGKTIYVADDWFRIIEKSKAKKPFSFYKMRVADFFSTKKLEEAISKRKKNERNEPVNWLKIQWLRFQKDSPYKIFYKETLNEDFPFDCINIRPAKKGRSAAFENINLDHLYADSLPVSTMKKQNMLELLQFIPPIHHNFFQSLNITQENNAEDIGPLLHHYDEDVNE